MNLRVVSRYGDIYVFPGVSSGTLPASGRYPDVQGCLNLANTAGAFMSIPWTAIQQVIDQETEEVLWTGP